MMNNAPAMNAHNKDIDTPSSIVLENQANNSTSAAKVTLITSHKPTQLTKVISLSQDGKLIKGLSANMMEGTAQTKELTSMGDFVTLLTALDDSQALVYGVPNDGSNIAKVVTKKKFEQLGSNTQGTITRTNDHFGWPSGAGIMMFDYDPDGDALDKDAVLRLLYDVCPAMRDVDHVWWMSSSSNIVNQDTGESLTGVTGQRIYVMVTDATDIPRAAKIIGDKLWLAGHGYIKISASGATLERVPFDMTVYQPSRLDFAAGAACMDPLMQDRGEPCLISGSSGMLDTKEALSDLTAAEAEQLDTVKLGKEATAKPKASSQRTDYVDKMKGKLMAVESCVSDHERQQMIIDALDNHSLPPSWPVWVWMGNELIEVSVETLLQNKYTYDGKLCLDPIEPDYDGGRLVGKLYLNQKDPMLNSFARGGMAYRLLDMQYQIDLCGNQHDAVEDTITILEQRKEIFTYGGVLVEPMNDRLVTIDRVKMMHHLGGIIQYVKKNKPCDPTSGLVDGVLSIGLARNITPVKGMIDHPIIDATLTMQAVSGYDAGTQLLTHFDQNDFDVLDRRLSDEEVREHLSRIYAPFVGFELAGNEDKSMLYAAIFSAVLRQALTTCPAFAMDAPMQGSGKTKLAATLGFLATGKSVDAMPPIGQTTDNELRKRLLSIFMDGEKVSLFDNLVGEFDSPSFAASLTSEYFSDRVLGYSKMVKVLSKTLFLLTGNNMSITGDMCRRVLRMRLTPKNDQLVKRKYDFDPVIKVAEMRHQIISSVLSLINHWKHCGSPKAQGTPVCQHRPEPLRFKITYNSGRKRRAQCQNLRASLTQKSHLNPNLKSLLVGALQPNISCPSYNKRMLANMANWQLCCVAKSSIQTK